MIGVIVCAAHTCGIAASTQPSRSFLSIRTSLVDEITERYGGNGSVQRNGETEIERRPVRRAPRSGARWWESAAATNRGGLDRDSWPPPIPATPWARFSRPPGGPPFSVPPPFLPFSLVFRCLPKSPC